MIISCIKADIERGSEGLSVKIVAPNQIIKKNIYYFLKNNEWVWDYVDKTIEKLRSKSEEI